MKKVSVQDRKSSDEKASEKFGRQLMDRGGWRFATATPFSDVEQLVVMLTDNLRRRGTPFTQLYSSIDRCWCVGGSLEATYARRNALGAGSSTSVIRLVSCVGAWCGLDEGHVAIMHWHCHSLPP
jgi:hypothetical protein